MALRIRVPPLVDVLLVDDPAHMAALSRARADRSVEGVRHVAEAFEALGDPAIVEQCLIIAEGLGASRYSDEDARLRALAGRVTVPGAANRIEP